MSWRVSPRAFQGIALAAVIALALTIISGAAVRLTGSGLGCNTWPQCDHTSVVAPMQFHAWVEFGNRLINALVTIASLGTYVAALRRRPRRPDLTWLSFGLVIGLIAEVVIGGVVVYTKLNPVLVSIHFVLGMAFLAVAVVLHLRSRLPDGDLAASPMVGPFPTLLARASLFLLTVVVGLGTVVTSAGPHGGSPGTPRYQLSLHAVAQVHGTSVEIYLALTVLLLWTLVRSGAPAPVMRRAEVMLVAMAAQAGVGYTQYFSGDPVGVVAVHVAGASVLVIAVLHFYFGLWQRSPVPVATASSLAGVGS
ncbi:MAG TPA: COX15/CtaA family protein [Acidimicrobiales bacterium]|jgi:cytochrome c oxidase assembly protein subunit 15|nr:COX15/CtaA family protein [Acidimicrobiales bacterium]